MYFEDEQPVVEVDHSLQLSTARAVALNCDVNVHRFTVQLRQQHGLFYTASGASACRVLAPLSRAAVSRARATRVR